MMPLVETYQGSATTLNLLNTIAQMFRRLTFAINNRITPMFGQCGAVKLISSKDNPWNLRSFQCMDVVEEETEFITRAKNFQVDTFLFSCKDL